MFDSHLATQGELRSSWCYISPVLHCLRSQCLSKLFLQFLHLSLQLPHISLCVFIDYGLEKQNNRNGMRLPKSTLF